MTEAVPKWLQIARGELGQAEVPGPGSNPRIVEYLRSTDLGAPDDRRDETPWCSAFVNWCIKQAGLKGTDSAAAASWRHWGVELEDGRLGCVVVMTRPGGNHVGFYEGENDDGVLVLGGNQGDQVSRKWFSWERVTNFRWPEEGPGEGTG